MRARFRFPSTAFLVALLLLGTSRNAEARPSKDEAKILASKAVAWALSGGLNAVKSIPESESVDVVDLNFPPVDTIEVPGRKITVSSLVRLQGVVDLRGSRHALFLNSIVTRGDTAKVSISARWLSPHKDSATPPPVQGALLELEKRNGAWEIVRIGERWP